MDYYYFPSSHWSRVVSLLIAEKGLAPRFHVVDIRRNASFEPDYVRLNPRGVVPTIVDDGCVVWDSMRIAAHLDEVAPPRLRSEASGWTDRLADFPLMHLSYFVWTRGLRGERSADILEDKVARARRYAAQYPELRDRYERKGRFFEAFRDEVYSESHMEGVLRGCGETLDELAGRVAEAPFIDGERWSMADALATSILYRLADLELLDAWNADPHPLHGYLGRLRSRPSFARVFVDDPRIPR